MEKIFIDELDLSILDKKEYIRQKINLSNWNLEFYFASSFSSSSLIRELVSIIWIVLDLEKIWSSRLVLIVDELVNNSIEYGSNPWEQNKIRIMFNKDNNWKTNLTIEVEDTWNWDYHKNSFEMEKQKKIRLNNWFENHESIRWRWLFLIILKLVDELYFKDTPQWWLIVWVKKSF